MCDLVCFDVFIWFLLIEEEAVHDYEAAGEVDRGGAQQVSESPETLWQGVAAHTR